MNGKGKKLQELKKFNDKLLLNGKKPQTLDEYESMERFEKAYSMESERLNTNKKVKVYMLYGAIILIVVLGLIGGQELILELVKAILK